MSEAWPSLFRFTVGIYWLYFASTKWTGVGWMKGLMESAGAANPIPGLREILINVVAPNWYPFAILQTIGETVVGVLLVVNLALVVAFQVQDDGFRWLYYLAVLVNAQVIVSGPGPYALSRFGWVPRLLR